MYKVLILLIFTQIISVIDAFAQPYNYEQMKLWQLKGYAKHAEKMDDTYTAISIYSYLVNKKPTNTDFKWSLAIQAQKSRDYKLSYQIFNELSNIDKKNATKAAYYKAINTMSMRHYNEALEIFDSILSLKNNNKFIEKYDLLIENHIDGCNLALEFNHTSSNISIDRINESVNHAHIEFNPFFLSDTSFIYGSSNINKLSYYPTDTVLPKRKFLAANYINNKWIGGITPEKPFNFITELDAGAGVFSIDKQRFYFTKCHKTWKGIMVSQLYVSNYSNNIWQDPLKLGDGINLAMYSSSEPAIGTCYDPNLEVVYFTSNRPGGHGNRDIWFSIYDKIKGTYQKPINAGIFLNTAGNEASPFYDIHNHRIYFSSDGHVTMGGMDVMFANGELVSWDEAVNIGLPTNSSYDDLFYSKNELGNKGFITSNRPGGKFLTHETCCDDIFAWSTTKNEKIWVEGKLIEEMYKMDSLLLGEKAIKQETKTPVSLDSAKIKLFIKRGNTKSDFVRDYRTDSLGEFKILVNKGIDYELIIDDKRVLNKKIELKKQNIDNKNLNVKIESIAIKTVSEQPIVLKSIYYEFNDYKLKGESKTILDNTLLRLMKEFPELLVEIRSHTDNKGSARFNLRLSKQRSNSVVEYLVSRGINTSRLKAVGFGETLPIAANTLDNGRDNPKGRAANRRTEFRLVDSEEINQ